MEHDGNVLWTMRVAHFSFYILEMLKRLNNLSRKAEKRVPSLFRADGKSCKTRSHFTQKCKNTGKKNTFQCQIQQSEGRTKWTSLASWKGKTAALKPWRRIKAAQQVLWQRSWRRKYWSEWRHILFLWISCSGRSGRMVTLVEKERALCILKNIPPVPVPDLVSCVSAGVHHTSQRNDAEAEFAKMPQEAWPETAGVQSSDDWERLHLRAGRSNSSSIFWIPQIKRPRLLPDWLQLGPCYFCLCSITETTTDTLFRGFKPTHEAAAGSLSCFISWCPRRAR